MNLKALISLFMILSAAISCSKVKFNNTPSQECALADQCVVGPSGETLSDNIIVPTPNNMVDILFVVDNSGTMIQEQQSIASRFNGFIQSLSGLDWQIAIATTDNMSGSQEYRDGKIVPVRAYIGGPVVSNKFIIKKSDANAAQMFAGTIQRPESNQCASNPSMCPSIVSGDERGILSTLKAVRNNSQSFMRVGSQLHIIIIADEDERSNGGGFPGMPLESGNDLPSDIKAALEGTGKRAKFHSIVNIPYGFNPNNVQSFNLDTCRNSQIGNTGSQEYIGCHYIQSSIETLGIVANIDSASYTDVLMPIANDIIDTSLRDYHVRCSNQNTTPTNVTATPIRGVSYPYFFNNPQLFFPTSQNLTFNQPIPAGYGFRLEWTCPRN